MSDLTEAERLVAQAKAFGSVDDLCGAVKLLIKAMREDGAVTALGATSIAHQVVAPVRNSIAALEERLSSVEFATECMRDSTP